LQYLLRLTQLVAALTLGLIPEPLLAFDAICGIDPAPLRQGPAANPFEVIELQERLQTLGYFEKQADGVFDATLEATVRRFQLDHALAPDGVVGSATWQALAGEDALPGSAKTASRPQGELHILIDTQTLRLTLFADGKVFKSYPIATGKQEKWAWSPVGEWRIVNKGVNWGGGFGTRWMGLNVPWGIYGIHGTNKPYSIGSRASGGCIRMFNRDVEELYSWVPLGTKVVIKGDIPRISLGRVLSLGSTGRDVVAVQQRLQNLGFGAGGADGRWGQNSAQAVQSLQRLYGLPEDGTVYTDVYYVLGLK
jgi:hypothetical protein